MATDSYGILEDAGENQLHTSRLLPIEQKPFQRISKRLLASESPISRSSHLPSPPPDAADEEAAEKLALREQKADLRQQWREELMLDFAALESSVTRIQLLRDSNERERKRYADEKIKIVDTAEAIKSNTAELRIQLEEARATKESRTKYDELAEAILKNKTLKSREDQDESMKKINAEIAEEEKKGREFEEQWQERLVQFNKILEECKVLQRIISDEPEEEVMEKVDAEGDGDDMRRESDDTSEGARTRGRNSAAGTPAPDTGGVTPMPNHDEDGLKPLPTGSRAGSTAPSPGRRADDEGNDLSMGDVPGSPAASHSSLEEGEEGEASETNTPMEQ